MMQHHSFGSHLRLWRKRRGLSQLDLAGAAAASQRHVSFLESGRSQPSREMVLCLAAALDVPLRQQNTLLLAAGFAPIWRQRGGDPVDGISDGTIPRSSFHRWRQSGGMVALT
jgi:transcriptional regulator with XRE-family HTH domain